MAVTRPILYATDFSPASGAAFRAAIDAARHRKAEMLIAHVMAFPVPAIGDGVTNGRTYERLIASVREDAERRLRPLVRRARAHGIRVRSLVLEGFPFEAIVAAARRHRAQLVVMGTHGRTGLRRLILGSVAARVIGLCPCPVLSVRPARPAARNA